MSERKNQASDGGAASYYGNASVLNNSKIEFHIDNCTREYSSLPSQGDSTAPCKVKFTKSKLQTLQKSLLRSSFDKYQEDFNLVVGKGIPKHKPYCSEISKVCRNEVSKELHDELTKTETINQSLKSKNRRVVFIGPARTGKTHLTVTAALSLMKSGVFDYVFYCDLKTLKRNMESKENKKISLHEFFHNLRTTHALEEYIRLLKKIEIKNNKTLIILDEISCCEINSYPPKHNDFGKEGTIEEHLWNIIFGDYFANAKKIVLTRPFNLQWSPTWKEPEFIHMIGINHDFTKMEKLISSDFVLLSPFFLDLFKDYCKIAGVNNITNTGTLVHIFFEYFDLVQNDGLGNLELKELAEFAYSQFEINKLCFKTKILKDNCIDHKYLELFFDDLPSSDPGLKYSSYSSAHFLHILVQEFLAANHIMFFLDKSQLLGVFQKSISPSMFVKYQMVCTFVCGLCNESLKNSLSIRFGKDCTDFIERCKTFESKFESIFKNTLKTQNEMIIKGFYGFLNEMQNKKLRNKCLKLSNEKEMSFLQK